MRRWVWVPVVVAVLSGCESATIKAIREDFRSLFQTHKGAPDLASGIRQYENANYAEAARQLQSALDQGLAREDQVRAHKYLAFIHCSSNRERQCRDEFRKALAIDPALELAPAETGHPVWGPIFRSLKAGR